MEREQERLLMWVAAGLAAVSVLSGLLYFLYYLKVGNEVTSILPRETVAYVRIGPAGRLKEAFQNLDVWVNTRPIRSRIREHEQALVSQVLLDIGVNSGLLDKMEEGLSETHLAVIERPAEQTRNEPYDVLFFFRFHDDAARDALLSRITPFFDTSGDDSGVRLAVRGAQSGTTSLATFDAWVVLCWGSDATLREILKNRERGPSRTLNDSDGFRMAYRAHAHEAEVWAYIRHDHFIEIAMSRLFGQTHSPEQRRAMARYAALAKAIKLSGVGMAVNLSSGNDTGTLGIYGGDLGRVARQTGARNKNTLSAIPRDSLLAVALSVAEPDALFDEWRGPTLKILEDLGVFGEQTHVDSQLNRLQAETGAHLQTDVWPNFAGELAVALVPKSDTETGWLVVVDCYNTTAIMDIVSRVAGKAFRNHLTQRGRVQYRFSYERGLHYITASEQRPGPTSLFETVSTEDVLCWASAGSKVLIGEDCDVVSASMAAEQSGGMDRDDAVRSALASFPERTTAVAFSRVQALLASYPATLSLSEVVNPNYLAALALTFEDDRLEITGNVSPLSLGFLAMTPEREAFETDQPGAESAPCRRLADALCAEVPTYACAQWRTLVAGRNRQTCRTGLRTLDSFRPSVR